MKWLKAVFFFPLIALATQNLFAQSNPPRDVTEGLLFGDTVVLRVNLCGLELDTGIVLSDTSALPMQLVDAHTGTTSIIPPGKAINYGLSAIGTKPGNDTSILLYEIVGTDTTEWVEIVEVTSNLPHAISDSVLDFGSVDSGMMVQTPFPIVNEWCDTLTIDSVIIRGSTWFSIDSLTPPIILPPSFREYGFVSFHPFGSGPVMDTLILVTSDGTRYRIRLTGDGLSAGASVLEMDPTVSHIIITPNPGSSASMLRISANTTLENVVVTLYNPIGRAIEMRDLGTLFEGINDVPLSLPPTSGLYYVRITVGGKLVDMQPLSIAR